MRPRLKRQQQPPGKDQPEQPGVCAQGEACAAQLGGCRAACQHGSLISMAPMKC